MKTPTILQMEAVECGAAALGIVLAAHGRIVPLEELRIACGVSRDGSKASNIVKAARHYGLRPAAYRKEPEELYSLSLPFIVHWNFNHFLVVEGYAPGRFYLNDPSSGPRTVSAEEFDKAFTGVVLTFEPTPAFQKGRGKPTLLSLLAARTRGAGAGLLFVFLASLALVAPTLSIPVFTKLFVDEILVAGARSWMWPLFAGMALAALLRAGLTAVQHHYLLRLETKMALVTSSRFIWHVLRLPMEFYFQRHAGDIASRVEANDRIARFLSGRLAGAALDVVMIVFYAAAMWYFDPTLTLAAALCAALNFALLRWVGHARMNASARLLQERGKLAATSVSGLSIIETLKASGAEAVFFSRWSGNQAKVARAEQELGVFTQWIDVFPRLLQALTAALILAVGGLRIFQGELTAGGLAAFQSLLTSFLGPVNRFVGLGGELQEVSGDMNRLEDVARYPVQWGGEPASAGRDGDGGRRLSGRLDLRGVTFGYSRLEPPLIEGFHLTLEPGSRVALVGPTGSGKSTLAKLVGGLFEPWEGEILFDGRPRSEIPRLQLVRSLGMVDQEISLFEGTIRENLTMWNPEIPESDIVQAAIDACIHDEIVSRPGGYDAMVEEGGRNFSGGQRQRLEIARALVNRPTILVLDEATSALDPVTEQAIDDRLRKRGCTCLIVAHRLSTIRDCDEIIVLDRGNVVQRGTHDQMKDADGPYARLIRSDEVVRIESAVQSLLERLV